jgi:octaheme c-type cytochrome (tetrathionate reductase family)
MQNFRYIWLVGLTVTAALIMAPIIFFLPKEAKTIDDPWAHMPVRSPHTDHTDLIEGPFESGSQVTHRCLECHEDASDQMIKTVHWTWESQPYQIEGRLEPVTIGKKNTLNNFCIGIQSNWPGCTSCHAGYGWMDANFDFSKVENVDCLVCHERTGLYVKGTGGQPVEGVDLVEAAKSVDYPTRDNCGGCHFKGGGGNGVKHGDLDEHLRNPPESVDVHMGRYNFVCTDCHQTQDHNIRGRAISVSLDLENQIYCTDCHNEKPHEDDRLNAHQKSVSCQSCHIPAGAVKDPTKMSWDWSTAGQDIEEDPHTYLKIKGSFVYESDFVPEYYWFSGVTDRYLLGDEIDPEQVILLNPIDGNIRDPNAKIFPFKVHRARQPYDTVNHYLLQPKTFGEGGFWIEFDWDQSLELGSEVVGLDYSGEYGFAETEMLWSITHMVAPVEQALNCNDCHGDNGRLDWQALGYSGDPLEWGGRFQTTP